MGQRGGACVGCRLDDIKEFKRLSEYLLEFKLGIAEDFYMPATRVDLPPVRIENAIVSVIEYLDGCQFPVTMKRINSHFKSFMEDKDIYETVPAVKYAVLSKAVETISDSKINRYRLTGYGREIAELVMFARICATPLTSSQSAPYPVPVARSRARSSSPRRARA